VSDKLVITVLGESGNKWTQEFRGDDYGYELCLAIMTSSDVVERSRSEDSAECRLVFQTTAKIARDRLGCYGYGGPMALAALDLGLRTESR
jgi:hypothetical protein